MCEGVQGPWSLFEFAENKIRIEMSLVRVRGGYSLAYPRSQLKLPVLDPKMTAAVDLYRVGKRRVKIKELI